jgi:2-polyprenyl-3-methyl-5-hydroxy-6-metoxy-1,4-benzoquinol methylase
VDAEIENAESAKVAELGAIIQAVRDRVRARYPEADANGFAAEVNGAGAAMPYSQHSPRQPIRVPIADLMPVVHARDAAQAKIAAIGSVNPRAGGLFNQFIQTIKKTVARALQWFVRDQVAFNREAVSAIEAVIEALNEHNRVLVSLATQANEQIEYTRGDARDLAKHVTERVPEMVAEVYTSLQGQMTAILQEAREIKQEAREIQDIRSHWPEYRADFDRRVATNEIQFLRNVADLQAATQHRTTLLESNFRECVDGQHKQFEVSLALANLEVQRQVWRDMEKIRQDYDRLIHTELRLIRQRARTAGTGPVETPQISGAPAESVSFDYGRFAERFRGGEDYVRRNVEFYKPYFAGRENVLDIGCGRGEFLEMMRENGVAAQGIDLSDESVAQCREKGLQAEAANLFPWLTAAGEQAFDGIFSSQVVEHLDPKALPEMIRLCASRLRRGGLLALETPNPECLAIFATHFYLDPTHTRPIPHPLLAFYMEEAGLGSIEVHELSPAIETMPELAALPEEFRKKFFGGLDYAIIGRKL